MSSSSGLDTSAARSARWSASSAIRCQCGSSRTRPAATAPTAISARGTARCCGSAPTARRSSSVCAGWPPSSPPSSRSALERLPAPLDLRAINADAVQMGDEVHNRNRAGTSLVVRALAPRFPEVDAPSNDVAEVARFIAVNDYFYLNLSMASGKATADAASGIEHSTIVTAMARNGTEFGLRVSGTGRALVHRARRRDPRPLPPRLPRRRREPRCRRQHDHRDDRARRLRDGCVAGDQPLRGHQRGGSAEATLAMYEITWAESVNYRIPALGFRGSPLGIDCRKVVETGIVADRQHRDRAQGAGRRRHRRWHRSPSDATVRGRAPGAGRREAGGSSGIAEGAATVRRDPSRPHDLSPSALRALAWRRSSSPGTSRSPRRPQGPCCSARKSCRVALSPGGRPSGLRLRPEAPRPG